MTAAITTNIMIMKSKLSVTITANNASSDEDTAGGIEDSIINYTTKLIMSMIYQGLLLL